MSLLSQLNMAFLVSATAIAREHNALLGMPQRDLTEHVVEKDFPSLSKAYSDAGHRASAQSKLIVKNNYPKMIYRDNHMTYVN